MGDFWPAAVLYGSLGTVVLSMGDLEHFWTHGGRPGTRYALPHKSNVVVTSVIQSCTLIPASAPPVRASRTTHAQPSSQHPDLHRRTLRDPSRTWAHHRGVHRARAPTKPRPIEVVRAGIGHSGDEAAVTRASQTSTPSMAFQACSSTGRQLYSRTRLDAKTRSRS